MMKIILNDTYDGQANVLVKFSEDSGTFYRVLTDFLDIAGDELSDMAAALAARKLYTYLRAIGYPVVLDSPDPSLTNFTIDLPSGNIMTSSGGQVDVSDQSLSITQARPISVVSSQESEMPYEDHYQAPVQPIRMTENAFDLSQAEILVPGQTPSNPRRQLSIGGDL